MPAPSSRRPPAPQIRAPQGAGIRTPEQPEMRRLQGALELPIGQIRPDSSQPRRDWRHDGAEERLAELVESIREFGVLQPLLVNAETSDPGGVPYYPLIAGNRRLLAAQQAGLLTVPVLVRDTQATDLRMLQLTENLQRQNLAPLDEARAYQELIDLKKCSPRQLALQLHISDQQVRLRLRLLSDQVLADAVERRQIAANTARLIQQLPDDAQEPFRERVRLGEHLQENDLAAVRARLLADGIIHPRRTRPARSLAGAQVEEAKPAPSEQAPSFSAATDTGNPPNARPAAGQRLELPRVLQDGEGQIPFDPMPHTAVGLPLPESGGAASQRVLDPIPRSAGTQEPVETQLAALLAAADPEARRMLGRAIRSGQAPAGEPWLLAEALRLAGALLRTLAASGTADVPSLQALVGADDE